MRWQSVGQKAAYRIERIDCSACRGERRGGGQGGRGRGAGQLGGMVGGVGGGGARGAVGTAELQRQTQTTDIENEFGFHKYIFIKLTILPALILCVNHVSHL